MTNRTTTALLIAIAAQTFVCGASAENQMGYQLLPASQAAALPRGGGTLGIDVGRQQQITDGGMTFELLRVNSVRARSAAAEAGLKAGDEIIAVDGHVFPSVAAFAGYVGSGNPGHQIMIDYMPAGGGPQQAQRIGVVLGGGAVHGNFAQNPATSGLSNGTKIAIGVGAAALFGCYELGCFTRHKTPPVKPAAPQQPGATQQPAAAQQPAVTQQPATAQ